MPRKRVPFKRESGKKSSRLVVIACEGTNTEPAYFQEYKRLFSKSGVRIEILRREETASNPERILSMLEEFQTTYSLAEDDELWLVIDRDQWEASEIASIAQQCTQNSLLNLAVSTPCFELWLLLHRVDIAKYSEDKIAELLLNKSHPKQDRTPLRKELYNIIGRFNHKNLTPHVEEDFLQPEYIQSAIERSQTLDSNLKERWIEGRLGTRVYLLVQSLQT